MKYIGSKNVMYIFKAKRAVFFLSCAETTGIYVYLLFFYYLCILDPLYF